MVKRGHLTVPVIGVAKANRSVAQVRDRVPESLSQFGGGVDEAAFAKLVQLLRFMDGDYRDEQTFLRLRQELGGALRPLYYLAIPPSMFPMVVEGLGTSGCAEGGGWWLKNHLAGISRQRTP